MITANENETPSRVSGAGKNEPRFIFDASFEEADAPETYGEAPTEDGDHSTGFMPDEATRDCSKRMHYAAWRASESTNRREATHWRGRYHELRNRIVVGNRKLTETYRKLIKELSLFRRLNLADGWLMPLSAHAHRQIVKTIASGDADAAGRAMFNHVMESKQRTIENDERRRARLATQSQRPAAGLVVKPIGKTGSKKLAKVASEPKKESTNRDKR